MLAILHLVGRLWPDLFKSRRRLEAENLFLRHQLSIALRRAPDLIRKWDATDASVHDSQKLDDVLDLSNTGKGVWADSAYRSVQKPLPAS
jgi:IS5 family transposase